jgi:hypothetical protein
VAVRRGLQMLRFCTALDIGGTLSSRHGPLPGAVRPGDQLVRSADGWPSARYPG